MTYEEINENLRFVQVAKSCDLKTENKTFYAKVSLVSGIINNDMKIHRYVNLAVDASDEELEDLQQLKKFIIVVNSNLEIPIDEYAFDKHIHLFKNELIINRLIIN